MTNAHAKLVEVWPEGNDEVVGTSISGSGSRMIVGGRSRCTAYFTSVFSRLIVTAVAATSRIT